jgi:hypothetical protein
MTLLAIALGLPAAGCGKLRIRAFEQPAYRIDSAPFDAGPGVGRTSASLPAPSSSSGGIPWFPQLSIVQESPTDRLHPLLRAWLRDSSASKAVRVIVGFRERLRIPRLPLELMVDDTSHASLLAATQSAALVDSVRKLRAPYYRADTTLLKHSFGARILATYVLAQGVLAELPLGRLLALAARNDVVSIEPESSGDPPPGCANPAGPTVADAKQDLGTDPLASLGYGAGRLAILDTGVQATHDLLADLAFPPPPATVPRLRRFDYTGGATGGAGPNVDDLELSYHGHGTKTASILVGENPAYALHEGVTRARLDSYQVYEHAMNSTTRSSFRDALFEPSATWAAISDPVVLAEVQSGTGPAGFVSNSANTMFLLGAAVIAAAGDGKTTWIGAPGSAAWVMASGAYELDAARTTYINQSRGYALGRTKPEFQAPTGTLGASTDDHDCLSPHTATSGAAPYAAGVALLLRNWMSLASASPLTPPSPIDPGQVYAAMIACTVGSLPGPTAPYPVDRGAGRLAIPGHGRGWWGKTSVGALGRVTIPIPVPPYPACRHFDVAIWWPDPPYPVRLFGNLQLVSHLQYALSVQSPAGGPSTLSARPNCSFESVHITQPVPSVGPWRLTISGQATSFSPMPVYWFFIARP